MGRNNFKSTKKDRLKEKRAAAKRARENKPPPPGKGEFDIDEAVKKSQDKVHELQDAMYDFQNKVLSDEEMRYVSNTSVFGKKKRYSSHFAGPDSGHYNAIYWKMRDDLHLEVARLDRLKDKQDPGRKARFAIQQASINHLVQNMIYADQISSMGSPDVKLRFAKLHGDLFGGAKPEKQYPKGVIVVERVAVGLLMAINKQGHITGIRCYHSKDHCDVPCDCEVNESLTAAEGYRHQFVLSKKSDLLL